MTTQTLKGSLWLAVILLSLGINLRAQNYTYTQSFESTNPFKFWTSNATYTLNYFGPSTDRYVDGTKSLKVDITINGSGTKECYYYWTMPLTINLQGKMDFSVYLWMDSETAKYVKLGYNYDFPPTGLTRIPGASSVTSYNTWFKQSSRLSDDIIYHADYFAKNKIFGSTYDDFGRQVTGFPLMIKAVGQKRLVFYIDKLQLSGTVMDQATYPAACNSWWSDFQLRLADIVSDRHTQYSNLPAIPNTSGITLTTKAQEYLNGLNKAKTDIPNLFALMDGKQYFAPTVIDSLDELLSLWPSLVEMLKIEINNQTSKLAVFGLNPTEYNRLTGSNVPGNIETSPKFNARVCAGEFEPFSLFLQSRAQVNNIKVQWTSLTGSGGTIPSTAINAFIVKVWYQNGYDINGRSGKWLTQELLIKNDDLLKIDETAKTNSIQVTKTDGTKYYINISGSTTSIPTSVKIKDSDVLLPFSLPAYRSKQLWFTLAVPSNTPAGIYTGSVTLSADGLGTVATIPVQIEVLPFKLDKSKISYGLYYHGYIDDANYSKTPFTSFVKSSNQYKIEMQDLKDHGVLYPTTFQSYYGIGKDLTIRNQVGLPKDKLFVTTFETGTPQSSSALSSLKSTVTNWKNKIAQYGYSNLHVYGIDEATGTTLLNERAGWQAVHEAGAKVFASGYYQHYDAVGDLLDVAIIQPTPRKEQADLYHSVGHQIYNYSNPMVGIEDPEIYRKNYGFLLWTNNYDGVMNYAYQRNFGHIWNDFDPEATQPHPYRDHNFTYPITDGIISTIEWEGFREGVDDIRYLSTLQNKIDSLKALGKDVSSVQAFINSIDPSANPEITRQAIIDKILSLGGQVGTVPPPTTDNIVLFAEQGTLTTGAALKTQTGSIGSKVAYCTSTSGSINFNVNFTQAAEYYVWGRFYFEGTKPDANCFQFSVDGGYKRKFGNNLDYYNQWHWGGYGNVESGTLARLSIGRFGAGQHKITISGYEVGATVMVDMVLITTDSSYIPNDKDFKPSASLPSGNNYLLVAEQGTLTTGAALKTQTGSLGSKVAYCTSTSGSINFNVNFTQAAEYYAWGRFYFEGAKPDANSFYFSVDGGYKRKFGNNQDYYNKWHWGGYGNVESGELTKLSIGRFGAGQHKISISGYETGQTVMVDMILITTDANYVPTDEAMLLLKTNNSIYADSKLPTEFGLSQNYPNPFNPSTRLKYSVPMNARVTIKVFDMLGKEVATLINENKNAGYYELSFDANSLNGGLASGIYIYQMRAEGVESSSKIFTESKKMVLIK